MNNKSGDCLNAKMIYTDKTLPDFEDGALDLPIEVPTKEHLFEMLDKTPTLFIDIIYEALQWINNHKKQHDLDD